MSGAVCFEMIHEINHSGGKNNLVKIYVVFLVQILEKSTQQ